MEIRARDIVDWARNAIQDLTAIYGSKSAVFLELEKQGVSKHWAQKFECGIRDNPTQEQLDKLVAALEALISASAAA